MTNRSQKTKFESFTSDPAKIESGIPQGSILGPLLFLCYTNDLPTVFENTCKMLSYADDTQLIVEASNKNDLKNKLVNSMTKAQNWYTNNLMMNHPGKTEIIMFNPKLKENDKLEISITENGKEKIIKSKENIKILGLFIDTKLSWTKHIKTLKKTALNTTRKVHRINYYLPTNLRLMLYNSLISPHFNYADIIWGGCNEKESQMLQKVQNFAAKSIDGKRKYDSASAALKKSKLLNLKTRRQIHETVFVHKAIIGKNAENICKIFNKYKPTVSTRRAKSHKLNIPKHTFSKFKRSPLHRSIKSWNNTPDNFPMDNVKTRKNLLQKQLITLNYGIMTN